MADRQKIVELEVSIQVLHHDHDTMNKVYASIWRAMGIPEGPEAINMTTEQRELAQNIVSEMQNAGILFRERKPND